ncbi:MAG: ATP synthase F1 subunit delta [Candidatus Omnitrophica bacterium]|jgi:F-type H+-transporting ATPase subunit delta|nr:ATP synthase F1 subunit delta [Candidatus Omnitrophota bacterium]
MIKDEIVAKRYADAFAGFMKETVGLEKGLEDLKDLKSSVIRNNPEFIHFLESQEITYSEKCDFIDKVVRDGFSEELREFLKLLLRKERINKLADIMEYLRITYSYMGEEDVLLKTSFPLDIELIRTIEQRLERKFQKKFKFYIDLDGELLGGVQVIIRNTVIDGSVRRRLDELKEKLIKIRV